MKRLAPILTLLFLLSCGDMPSDPPYFIALHLEPQADMETEYQALQALIEYSNANKQHLTIMFTPQWIEWLKGNNKRLNYILGHMTHHELAAHHHALDHGVWDGYSNEDLDTIEAAGKLSEYLGDMSAYMDVIRSLGADIRSGCMNEEGNWEEIPTGIYYLTCSGYVNQGEPGTYAEGDNILGKAVSDYIMAAKVNGEVKHWITHTQVDRHEVDVLVDKYHESGGSVFGVIAHCTESELTKLYELMSVLEPSKSRTLTELIEGGILPVERI
jgi:hypothetical protein